MTRTMRTACRSREDWGKEKREGGPRKWEVRRVRHENEVRRKSYFVFVNSSLPQSNPTDDMTRGTRRHYHDRQPVRGAQHQHQR